MQPRTHTSGEVTLDSLRLELVELRSIVSQFVEFGRPSHPTDPTNATLATGAIDGHNGRTDNIYGSWVEKSVSTLLIPLAYTHNLNVPVSAPNIPNVRWLNFGFQHNGAGVTFPISVMSINYRTGDAVTPNAISLRLFSMNRIVTPPNPIKVSLFFIPATR